MCSESVLPVHFRPETLATFLSFSLDQVCRRGKAGPFLTDPGDEDTKRGVEKHQAGRGHTRGAQRRERAARPASAGTLPSAVALSEAALLAPEERDSGTFSALWACLNLQVPF